MPGGRPGRAARAGGDGVATAPAAARWADASSAALRRLRAVDVPAAQRGRMSVLLVRSRDLVIALRGVARAARRREYGPASLRASRLPARAAARRRAAEGLDLSRCARADAAAAAALTASAYREGLVHAVVRYRTAMRDRPGQRAGDLARSATIFRLTRRIDLLLDRRLGFLRPPRDVRAEHAAARRAIRAAAQNLRILEGVAEQGGVSAAAAERIDRRTRRLDRAAFDALVRLVERSGAEQRPLDPSGPESLDTPA